MRQKKKKEKLSTDSPWSHPWMAFAVRGGYSCVFWHRLKGAHIIGTNVCGWWVSKELWYEHLDQRLLSIYLVNMLWLIDGAYCGYNALVLLKGKSCVKCCSISVRWIRRIQSLRAQNLRAALPVSLKHSGTSRSFYAFREGLKPLSQQIGVITKK